MTATSQSVDFSVVEKLFQQNVLPVQRAHEDRIFKTKYLHGDLWGDQLIFTAAKFGKLIHLVDGYSRCEAINAKLTSRPKTVVLITHVVKTRAELFRLYDQINNLKAAKKGRDQVQEGLRLAGAPRSLVSGLMTRGALRTAAVHASNISDVRVAVVTTIKAIQFLDGLGLSKGHVTAGQLAGFLAIAHKMKDKALVERFIRNVHQNEFTSSDAPEDIGILLARRENEEFHRKGATSGGNNVNALRDRTLATFKLFYLKSVAPSNKSVRYQFTTLSEFNTWAEQVAA